MKSSKNEQRNNMYGFLAVKSRGQSYAAFFDEDAKIIIYGCGVLGRALCQELMGKRNILCMLDVNASDERFGNVSLISPNSEQAREVLKENSHAVVIVTTTYDFSKIEDKLHKIEKELTILPICALSAYFEVDYFISDPEKKEMLTKLVLNKSYKKPLARLVLVNSMYSLLIYIINNNSFENTLFITQSFKVTNEMINYLVSKGGRHISIGNKVEGNYFDNDAMRETVRALRYYSFDNEVEVFGQDFLPYTLEFLDCKLTVIEDGFVSYLSSKECKELLPEMCNALDNQICFAEDDSVHNVWFIREKAIPACYREKAVFVDLMKMWNAKTLQEKKEIYGAFSLDETILNELNGENTKIIMATTDFVGNNLCDEDTQIQMFKELMKDYKEEEVIIKTHPNDIIDYGSIFPKAKILHGRFPMELLLFCDTTVEKIVGIQSNVLKNLDGRFLIEERKDLMDKYLGRVKNG